MGCGGSKSEQVNGGIMHTEEQPVSANVISATSHAVNGHVPRKVISI